MLVHGDQYLRAKFKYERKSFEFFKKCLKQTLKSNQPAQYINHRQPPQFQQCADSQQQT